MAKDQGTPKKPEAEEHHDTTTAVRMRRGHLALKNAVDRLSSVLNRSTRDLRSPANCYPRAERPPTRRLAQHPARNEFADAALVVAENLFEDVLAVVPERGSGAIDDGGSAREFEARILDVGVAGDGMIHAHEMFAMAQLRIVVSVEGGLDGVGGHAARLQHALSFIGSA